MPRPARRTRDRLLMAGLIGAGLLTVTWWVLLAFGVWEAIGWASA